MTDLPKLGPQPPCAFDPADMQNFKFFLPPTQFKLPAGGVGLDLVTSSSSKVRLVRDYY